MAIAQKKKESDMLKEIEDMFGVEEVVATSLDDFDDLPDLIP
jgi:hypothetical protein